jgi:multidrug efflux system membrane fusion protein
VLARIDPTDYDLAVKSAQAALTAAERQVDDRRACPQARRAALRQERSRSKSQLEQATLSYDQAVSTRDSARSTLDQAKNQVAIAISRPTGTASSPRSAPMSARWSRSGTPVITVAVDGEKEVLIAVPEMDIAEFKPGKDVKAGFWSDDALVLDGKVREVSGSADQQSRTFAVRVSLPNDPRVLLGMTATIEASAAGKPSLRVDPAERAGRKGPVDRLDRRSAPTVHRVKVAAFVDGVRVAEGLKHRRCRRRRRHAVHDRESEGEAAGDTVLHRPRRRPQGRALRQTTGSSLPPARSS